MFRAAVNRRAIRWEQSGVLKMILASFVLFLAGFLAIGLLSSRLSTGERTNESSYAAVLSGWQGEKQQSLQRLIALVALFFLLGWPTWLGAALALLWALVNQQSVFNLVIMSWSGMASAFAPLLIVLALDKRPSPALSIAMLFSGLGTALLWHYLGWEVFVYAGVPGIIVGLLAYVFASPFSTPVAIAPTNSLHSAGKRRGTYAQV